MNKSPMSIELINLKDKYIPLPPLAESYLKLVEFVKEVWVSTFCNCNCCINQSECKDCLGCSAKILLTEIGEN